jgi:uncharacterized tellurite resistance protein B-like protein
VIFKRKGTEQLPADARERLAQAVKEQLPEVDDGTRALVTAVAGLLACVAYADREYSDEEQAKVRQELERVRGLSVPGVEAICHVLRQEIRALSMAGDHSWVRDLKDYGDRELRYEVLEVLVDIAAADHELSTDETNYLRRLTQSLGLDQRDYDTAQARHRDKLSVLK